MENDVPQRRVSPMLFLLCKIKSTARIFICFVPLLLHRKKEQPAAKYAFPNEDDDQEDPLNIQAKQSAYGATSSSHQSLSYSASKYETAKQVAQHPPPPVGPSVLDKFGKENSKSVIRIAIRQIF